MRTLWPERSALQNIGNPVAPCSVDTFDMDAALLYFGHEISVNKS